MKEDVERRERAQAAVIENQAKRLEELETLYKARRGPAQRMHINAEPKAQCRSPTNARKSCQLGR